MLFFFFSKQSVSILPPDCPFSLTLLLSLLNSPPTHPPPTILFSKRQRRYISYADYLIPVKSETIELPTIHAFIRHIIMTTKNQNRLFILHQFYLFIYMCFT